MDAHYWCVLLGSMMGLGLFISAKAIERWYRGGMIPKDFTRWHDELEHAALEAIRADMHAAEMKARLVQLVGQIPEDFNPTAFLGVNIAAGVHRAVLAEAEARGYVQSGLFERVYGAQELPTRIDAPTPHQTAEARPSASLPPTMGLVWNGGRLVPAQRNGHGLGN